MPPSRQSTEAFRLRLSVASPLLEGEHPLFGCSPFVFPSFQLLILIERVPRGERVIACIAQAHEVECPLLFVYDIIEAAMRFGHNGTSAWHGRFCGGVGRIVYARHGGEHFQKINRMADIRFYERGEGFEPTVKFIVKIRLIWTFLFYNDFASGWAFVQCSSSSSLVT